MLFRIEHHTRYRYDRAVFLEPQTIRLRPREDACQRLQDFALDIDPAPAGLSHGLDAEGNVAALAWFDDLTEHLAITARSAVLTCCPNPFDFVLADPSAQHLPMVYAEDLRTILGACLSRPAHSWPVAEFAAGQAARARGMTLDFLTGLCREISHACRVVHRPDGDPFLPEDTLARKEGSCRDLAVLFIAACRSQGLAARFVSGYQEGDPGCDRRDLHAWAEVYLPGGGWRGFDPTLGLAVCDRHVALAASARPDHAAPVSGRFRGTGAAATLDFSLAIFTENDGGR